MVQQASREADPQRALLLWQRAKQLLRGEFLADDLTREWISSRWVKARRQAVRTVRRRMVRHLADLHIQLGQHTFAEEILHEHIIQFPTDQDALYRLMHLLVEQACIDEALSYYEQCKHALAALGKQPADHIRALVDSLRVTPQQDAWYLVHGMPKALSSEYSEQRIAPPSLIHLAQSIIGAGSKREEQEMDRLRRQLLQGILRVTGASVIAPYSTLLNSDSVERLSRALTRPASLDKQTLHYLERRIGNYWQDRNDVILPAQDLLPYVIEDLHKVTALLEGSLLPTVRVHLCSLAGEASMLVGELYYDMSNYAQARVFHDVAIIAAHEANNMALEAVAWARKSFAWTYDGNADEARICIQQACRLAWSVNSTVRAWLGAVEAEIQANRGDRRACLQALGESTIVEDHKHQKADCYWIHFDRSLCAGYQGVSFLRLSSRGHRDLIHNAQVALQDALDLLDPAMKRRQPTLLVDLAGAYVHQRNIEQACGYALQAMNIATEIKSQVSLQRLLSLRGDLEPWKETQYVRELDTYIVPLLTSGRRQESV